MTDKVQEKTTVVIIGAGVAGLTAGTLLKRCGIDCIVLEQRTQDYVLQRQRAGNIEARAVRMFEKWGLAERVVGGWPYEGIVTLRIDGKTHLLREQMDDKAPGRLCPQQVLVRNLMAAYTEDGGDLRFEASDVTLHTLNDEKPVVRYRDNEGNTHEITCDFIAGCDGDHGVSRASIPKGVLSKAEHHYGVSWVVVLTDVPTGRYPLMSVSDHGFAAQFPRGRDASRFYLQCAETDTLAEWSDARIVTEIKARCGEIEITEKDIVIKSIMLLYSVVYAPMRHGKLFLCGDAAHLVPPTSARGMNLAISDAETFVCAVRDYMQYGNTAGLDAYSDTCLERVWNYQDYAIWVTEMLHDAGDASLVGPFRHETARSRLNRLLLPSSTNKLFSEFMAGTV